MSRRSPEGEGGSSTVIDARNRQAKWAENGGESQNMDTTLQDKELDKKR
jgi:hypothetical protein